MKHNEMEQIETSQIRPYIYFKMAENLTKCDNHVYCKNVTP